MKNWRKQIEEISEEKGMSLQELAKKAKVSPQTVYETIYPDRYKRGGNPTVKWLEKIAEAGDSELVIFFRKKTHDNSDISEF